MVGRTLDWKEELGRWLKPFLDRLGHKARRQMCPLYVSGLNGPGDRKSIQPMAERHRRNSAPPPPKPRGGRAALAGERSEPGGLGVRWTMHCSVETAHFRLSDNVENLILQGNADLQGYGNGLSNALYGNSGNNPDGFRSSNPTTPATQSSQTGGPQKRPGLGSRRPTRHVRSVADLY